MRNGRVVFEDNPAPANQAHNLYSGTKSFACALAVAAADDGLLDLDEPVSRTITEWKSDPLKAAITIRQLLTLTSGIDVGVNGSMPTYRAAIKTRRLHEPSTRFQYGPIPFQVFGEVMRRKLAQTKETSLQYLTRRVFDPIGLKVHFWKIDPDGNPRLPGGAFLAAREWARYGELLLNHGRWQGRQVLDSDLLEECFHGTVANPGYGLSFWLPANDGINSEELKHVPLPATLRTHGPIIKAAGVGGQKLFIIPSLRLVIVRQGKFDGLPDSGMDDALFLKLIIENTLQPGPSAESGPL